MVAGCASAGTSAAGTGMTTAGYTDVGSLLRVVICERGRLPKLPELHLSPQVLLTVPSGASIDDANRLSEHFAMDMEA